MDITGPVAGIPSIILVTEPQISTYSYFHIESVAISLALHLADTVAVLR